MPIELNYSNLQGHESMLRDTIRCEAFRRAIFDTVTPGSTVLDIGAGTGILSLFAAQAGARRVYAVERTHIAELAKRIVADNGFADRIKVLENDMETITLPGKVDIIVSEWLGGYGVDENLLPILVHARDHWLKPGGRLIPETVSSWIAPAHDELLQEDLDFWASTPYGIDLSPVGQATARRLDAGCNHVRRKHLLSDPQMMWEVDGRTCTGAEANRPFRCRLAFVSDRDGPCNALAAWFRAQLTRNIVLCNGPSERDTHWGRTIFPVGRTLNLEQGMRVGVELCLEPQGPGRSRALWAVAVEGYRFHAEDITALTRCTAACPFRAVPNRCFDA